MQKQLNIAYQEISRSQLTDIEIKMETLAVEAARCAYAPYSKFKVGAALLLENNEIITASNQENAAYPSGLCAERNVLFYAGSKYPDVAPISMLLVAINSLGRVENISPCGACRQVIMESSVRFKPFKMILAGEKRIVILEDSRTLLPFGFDGTDLK